MKSMAKNEFMKKTRIDLLLYFKIEETENVFFILTLNFLRKISVFLDLVSSQSQSEHLLGVSHGF